MKKRVAILFIFSFLLSQIGASQVAAKVNEEVSAPLGTGITYQGYLEDSSGPVNDQCDFQFTLFGSFDGADQIGSTQTKLNISVADGYFTADDLDFGVAAFNGEARYLEISVRCPTGSGGYSPLSPRQSVMPAPYALSLPGLYTTPGDEGANIIGGYVGNTVKDGAFSATIGGGGVSWGANYAFDHADTVSGGANNQAGSDDEDFWNADGATVSGGWNNIANAPISTVGGGADNAAYAYAATVGGGQGNVAEDGGATIGGGMNNYVTGGSATVAGGEGNEIWWSWAATISGGYTNTIAADTAVIAGGMENYIDGWGGSIGGGSSNYAGEWVATVAGGDSNAASAPASTVSGGNNNTASGEGATVAGGSGNAANGDYSFAAGSDAYANHNGTFVWSDSTGGFGSTGDNQFLINASGGVGIGTEDPGGAGLAVTSDGIAMYLDGGIFTGSDYLTYAGFNTFWNPTYNDWFARTDSVHNAGSLITSSWVNGDLSFHTFDTFDGSFDQFVSLNNRMTIDGATGDVSIANDLDVGGDYSWQPYQNFNLVGSGEFSFDFSDSDGNDDWYVWSPSYGPILAAQNNGKVGVGTDDPLSKFEVFGGDVFINNGELGIGISNPAYPLEIYDTLPFIKVSDTDDGQFDNWLIGMNGTNGRFEIWEELNTSGNWQLRFWIDQDGLAGVSKLQITGGDLAEPFQMNGEVEPGKVVVIDPENPGQLRLSDQANDPLVAGCISGANGLDAGILMYQEIAEKENAFPVALSGRVYCYADAAYGVIHPGDFLTTSDTPGHLMVVKDREAATGAIVGKAMEGLEFGQGLILILVTLQ